LQVAKNEQQQKQIQGFFPFSFAQGQNDDRSKGGFAMTTEVKMD